MNILITGSSGHLGEALVRTLMNTEHKIIGVDLRTSEFIHRLGFTVFILLAPLMTFAS